MIVGFLAVSTFRILKMKILCGGSTSVSKFYMYLCQPFHKEKRVNIFFRKYLLRDQMLSLCPPNGFWWLSNFILTSSRKKRISVDGITNACMSFAILWNHDIDFQYGRQHSICRDTPMDGWWKIHQKELYYPVPLENKIKNLQTSHSSHLNFPFGALPKKT